ncbi:Nicotinamidase [Orbilia brochopaga]|nr:Nicotinamidase [Drechslerella brochopaga]
MQAPSRGIATPGFTTVKPVYTPRPATFRPALLVIDMQEDFCPPNGSLAVPGGRDVLPVVNAMLANRTFITRIATKDWHPPDHCSFAENHPAPDNVPFRSTCLITNPYNLSERPYRTLLWPIHCVQDTPGAKILPDMSIGLCQAVIEKGTDPRVEMYSAFRDPFQNPCVTDSGLDEKLRSENITHVYIVGLAFDYCVKYTAIDARRAGFEVIILADGTRAVHPDKWDETEEELRGYGITIIQTGASETRWLHAQPEIIYST